MKGQTISNITELERFARSKRLRVPLHGRTRRLQERPYLGFRPYIQRALFELGYAAGLAGRWDNRTAGAVAVAD